MTCILWVQNLGDEKLVRDKIPELIRSSGDTPTVRIASAHELDHFLRTKIVEEAKELLESGDIEEIVDILEVMDALLLHRKLDRDDITALQIEKRGRRGGFEKGFILRINENQVKQKLPFHTLKRVIKVILLFFWKLQQNTTLFSGGTIRNGVRLLWFKTM